MRHTVEGLNYPNALRLIDDLETNKIDCSIVAGGIAIYPTNNAQLELMKEICKNYNTKATLGNTLHEDNILYMK